MTTQVIVLNGGSSSGKTGIARCLQAILPEPWLRVGIDDLLDAMPPSPAGPGGITVGMAAAQASLVHEGVRYDVEGATSRVPALECARAIVAHVG